MRHSDFDIRMKENYEFRSRTHLLRRVPVIIRVDGKAFHTFCKRFQKPYDQVLNNSLNRVMEYLCDKIQGAKFAERHSDEISILVTDFDSITTDAYFDYNVQKICSVVASMATSEFCRELIKLSQPRRGQDGVEWSSNYLTMDEAWPNFDARCFNIPEHEVSNYFWWRMLDAKRGSINMQAQSKFSHKELQGKTCDQMQEMLFQEHGINWGKLPQGEKIGFVCRRTPVEKPIEKGPKAGEVVERNIWQAEYSPSNITDLREIVDGVMPTDHTKDD